jgi:hypothetical protein
MQDLIKFSHERQRFIMIDTRPPANAFEWRRYVVEEAIRRGEVAPVIAARVRKKTPDKVLENQRARRKLVQSVSIPISR